MNIRPRLYTPRSGPLWREGRDARRDRREAALRAMDELEDRAWRGRAWAEFARLDSYTGESA